MIRPDDRSWTAASPRYRMVIERNPIASGWRLAVSIVGVIAGFALFVVPGLFAMRDVREWEERPGMSPPWPFYLGMLVLTGVVALLVASLVWSA